MNVLDINNPQFLKNLSTKELNDLASDIREFTIKSVYANGGHLSSNLGTVELIIAIHYIFDIKKNKLLFDVGHQSYTHKILTGRAKGFSKLRQKGGTSGYQSFDEGDFDHLDAGHSGTSLGYAIGYSFNKNIENVISVIGDASFINGLNMECLTQINTLSKKRQLIFVNDNQRSISSSVGIVVENKNFFKDIAVAINFKYIKIAEGNNLEKIIEGIKTLDASNNYIIHVVTKKGYHPTNKYLDVDGKFHGINPFKEFYPKWSSIISESIEEFLKCSKNYVITPGTLIGSGISKLTNKRVLDVGISENLAFLSACGLYKSGYQPFILIYSTFLQRSFDQIIHDLSRLSIAILINVQNCGLVGSDGSSHQGLFDLNFLYDIPNINICNPSNILEYQECIQNHKFKDDKSTFIRTEKYHVHGDYDADSYEKLDSWKVYGLPENDNICIISYGNMFNHSINLFQNNEDYTLINALYLNNVNFEEIIAKLKTFKKIFVVEENYRFTGLYRELNKFYKLNNMYSVGINIGHIDYQTNDETLLHLIKEISEIK